MAAQTIRAGSLTTAATIAWSTGEAFNGYVLLGLALPTNSGTAVASLGRPSDNPQVRLPQWVKLPVVNGTYDSTIKLIYNADIQPPNSKYAPYFYDLTDRRIDTGTPALFTLGAEPYTLVPPTLTSPIAAVAPPSPES